MIQLPTGVQLGHLCHRGGEEAREQLILYSFSEYLVCVWHREAVWGGRQRSPGRLFQLKVVEEDCV